ncbi:MAG: YfhO family protein [Lachnospiraceae bacterium]|nr:YfhO family protein [Lachnospiraceae bacterium]
MATSSEKERRVGKPRRLVECVLLFCFVFLLVAICFYLHGEWPFGTLTIEGDDGYRQHIPMLYYLWDLLHGKKELFFDWDLALGCNPSGAVLHFGMLSPLHVLYLFIPRSAVLYSTSWMALLRLLLMAFSFRFLLRRLLPEETGMLPVILLSALYACNSWTFHYLYFSQWLDPAILLPFLLYALLGLLRDVSRRLLYVLLLAAAFLICVQQDYMLVIFLILFSGVFLLCGEFSAKERRAAVFRLGICSLLAFLIAAPILLPAVTQVTGSARMNNSVLYTLKEMLRSNADPDHSYDAEKAILSYTALNAALASLLLLIGRRIGKKKPDRFVLALLLTELLLLLPVALESCHYFWQGGVYLCFPLRGGYLYLCVGLLLLAKLLPEKITLSPRLRAILGVLVLLMSFVGMTALGKQRMLRAELGMHRSKEGLYGSELALYDRSIGNDKTQRYLDKTDSLQLNFPLVSAVPSLKNWVHIVPASLPDLCDKLGYYHAGSAIYGKGGTFFSDALLGGRYVLMDEQPDERLYENCEETDGLTIAESRLRLPFGLLLDEEALSASCDGAAEYQAAYARALTGTELFGTAVLKAGDEQTLCFEDEQLLYYDNPLAEEVTIRIGGETITVGGARIAFLGIRRGELCLEADHDGKLLHCAPDEILALSPEAPLSGISLSGHGLRADLAVSDAGRILFLPIPGPEGWDCRIDGEKAQTLSLPGGLLGIRLPGEGSHVLELSYHPPRLAEGLVLFFIGLPLLVLACRKKPMERLEGSVLSHAAAGMFGAVFAGVLFIAYLCNILLAILPSSLWWWLLKPK